MIEVAFTVAICVYIKDNPIWFGEALESIKNQTLLPNEVLIVTDGPITEELEAVITKYETIFASLRVVRLEKNVGFGNACQACIENSSYELVARMDSDDIAVKDRFEKQIKEFKEDPELDMLGGAIGIFETDVSKIDYYSYKPECHDEIKRLLKKRSPFAHVTMMYKKSKVMAAGGYIEWFCEEDYYLWARMLNSGCKGKNLSDPLVYVRTTQEQMGRRGGMKYYSSEIKMQKYLLKTKTINLAEFIGNTVMRFVAEILISPKQRYLLRKRMVWKKRGSRNEKDQ